MREDDFTIFCKKFQPIMAEEDEYSLRLYHWGGEDAEELSITDPDKIWTLVDADGKLYIIPGYHYVNRMDYIVTKIPWDKDTRDYKY